jgi:ATP-dependent DNA helicase RecQ
MEFPAEEIAVFTQEKYPTEGFSAAADILKQSKVRKTIKSGKGPDLILFERLKALRKELALKKNLPPYIIFSDTTLKEMATKFPQSPEEFHSITGVGDHKLRKYGDTFLSEIENYCKDYGLFSDEKEKKESSSSASKEPENNEIVPKSSAENHENSELAVEIEATEIKIAEIKATEIEAAGIKGSVPESEKIQASMVHRLPPKRTRYLDMSIQNWSEKDSTAESSNEKVLIGTYPESNVIEPEFHDLEPFEANNNQEDPNLEMESDFKIDSSLETDSLQRTYSLFTQGLEIDQIAEIQGLSMRTVFRQFEKLILTGKIKDIEGLLPPHREQQIKTALEKLEIELDSLIRTKMGDGCQEEELKLVRALFLSRIGFSPS